MSGGTSLEIGSEHTVGDFKALDTKGRPLRKRSSEVFQNPAKLRVRVSLGEGGCLAKVMAFGSPEIP